MRLIALLAAIAFGAAPAAAQADPSTPQTATAKPQKAPKICRDTGKKTGSRMSSGRTCKTAAEWSEIELGKKEFNVQGSQVGTISRIN